MAGIPESITILLNQLIPTISTTIISDFSTVKPIKTRRIISNPWIINNSSSPSCNNNEHENVLSGYQAQVFIENCTQSLFQHMDTLATSIKLEEQHPLSNSIISLYFNGKISETNKLINYTMSYRQLFQHPSLSYNCSSCNNCVSSSKIQNLNNYTTPHKCSMPICSDCAIRNN